MTELTQVIKIPGSSPISGPLGGTFVNPANVVSKLIPFIFFLAGFILLIMLIVSGYQFLTSRGEPKAVAQAWARLSFAIVGFLVVFGSYWILILLNTVLGGLLPI